MVSRQYSIVRQAIESGNVGVIAQRLRLLTASREDIWRYRSQVCLAIDGYDDDPREIIDVPQVRTFSLDNHSPVAARESDPAVHKSAACHG